MWLWLWKGYHVPSVHFQNSVTSVLVISGIFFPVFPKRYITVCDAGSNTFYSWSGTGELTNPLVSDLTFLKTKKETEKHSGSARPCQQLHKSPSIFRNKKGPFPCWRFIIWFVNSYASFKTQLTCHLLCEQEKRKDGDICGSLTLL